MNLTPKNLDPRTSPILLLLLGAASFVIVIAGMQAASSLLNAFFLSLIIALNVTPLLQLLIRKGLSPKLALLASILLVLGIGISLIAFLGISVSQISHILPSYEPKIDAFKESTTEFLRSKGFETSSILSLEMFQPKQLVGASLGFIKQIGNALGSSLLLLLIVAFMLVESSSFPIKLQKALKPDSILLEQLAQFSVDIRKYMFITAWTGALAAFGDFLILVFLGVDMAALWGVMFFLLSFIPGLGFLLAIIPPFLIALLKYDIGKAFLVFFGCWLIDNIVDKAIKPRFMQEGLDLSILTIILSILFWSFVLGPTGAILSVPLTMMVKKIILESTEDGRIAAILISGGGNDSEIKEEIAPEEELPTV